MQELERKLKKAETRKTEEDEQVALLEKSYQMAARYMPAQVGQPGEQATEEKSTVRTAFFSSVPDILNVESGLGASTTN